MISGVSKESLYKQVLWSCYHLSNFYLQRLTSTCLFYTVNHNYNNIYEAINFVPFILSSDLKWNNHIVDCIKKANKRLYFIVLLKRARVPLNDIVNFYCTTIRPVLEYCAPVFHYALPAYLNEDIERIQKRALSIISPAMSYRECLDSLGLPTLYDRRNGLCRQLFDSIAINPGHMLYHLLYQENNKAII